MSEIKKIKEEYFLKLIEMGDDRYKLMGDNPEYFAPYDTVQHSSLGDRE